MTGEFICTRSVLGGVVSDFFEQEKSKPLNENNSKK